MITTTHGDDDDANLRHALAALDAVATPASGETPPAVRVHALLAADHLVSGGVSPAGRPRSLAGLAEIEQALRRVLRCLAALHPDTYAQDPVLDAAAAARTALLLLEDSDERLHR
ncbi:MAG: hypothetical protein ACTHMS_05735 [Jatrophihabitans sp.]|uniref:hypothetical protein n=1 Tax=Jatrophihabitans sp. TaxID=1932789 RepID=UPI003F7CE23A